MWPHLDVAPAADPAGASSGSGGDAGAVVAVDMLDVLVAPGASAGGGSAGAIEGGSGGGSAGAIEELDLDEPLAPIDLVAEFSAEDHERLAAIEAGVLRRQRVYRGERRRAPHPHPSPVVWEKRNGRIYVAGETQPRGRLSCMIAWEPPSLSAVCFYHKDGGLCSVTSDINDRCETMLCEWIASAHLYDSSVAHREHRPEGLRARIR